MLDAAGCYVVPGLIDFHAHVFSRGTDSGVPADLACIPSGVTGVVDQESSGAVTCGLLLDQLAAQDVKAKIYLHVTPCGQSNFQHPEVLRPESWNKTQIARVFEEHQDKILGFKVRISKHVVLEQGLKPYLAAVEMADEFGKSLVVHVTDPPASQAEVVSHLRAGDVFCHMYHGKGHTILENGKILPEILEARTRGVLFDSAHGSMNFSYPVAEAALDQDFLPDVIGTDLTSRTWLRPPLLDLPTLLSKFMALGVPLNRLLPLVMTNPAKIMGMEGRIGCLTPGSAADITVLKAVPGKFEFPDSCGNVRRGETLLVPVATIVNGRIMFRRTEYI